VLLAITADKFFVGDRDYDKDMIILMEFLQDSANSRNFADKENSRSFLRIRMNL